MGKRKPVGETHGDYNKYLVRKDYVKVKRIASKENVADAMTKPLASAEVGGHGF